MTVTIKSKPAVAKRKVAPGTLNAMSAEGRVYPAGKLAWTVLNCAKDQEFTLRDLDLELAKEFGEKFDHAQVASRLMTRLRHLGWIASFRRRYWRVTVQGRSALHALKD